ncbi:hypothetical protein [Hahella sp. NBU794]|uniref:hypothetical protein n=1 Tax=Hahella sp. NBU794 TaxID=3422590 RepID=UPI003D6E125D
MRKGSGKQVFNCIIKELSTRLTPNEELPRATDRIRAGMLLHGSTSDESLNLVSKLHWASTEKEGEVIRQGIATINGNVFVADLLDSIWANENIRGMILSEFPHLTQDDYEACLFSIWTIVSSTQMFTQLLSVETDDQIDVDDWVRVVSRKLSYYDDESSNR